MYRREEILNNLIKMAEINYRGQTFPGYNKPIRNDAGGTHKMKVLAKKGDKVKVVRFGHRSYGHNYSSKAKSNYLKRSAGIRNKSGELTKNDKFSANHWARKVLWPQNRKADGGTSLDRKKTASVQNKKKRKMSHVNPDRYNDSFRLGQTIGGGLAGANLGAAIGGWGYDKPLIGAGIGAVGGAILGNKTYKTKNDDLVYRLTRRTPRNRVKPSLLADIKDVDPKILSANKNHFMSDEELSKNAAKKYRPRVEVYTYDNKGRILVGESKKHSIPGLPASTSYMFPGGGIENNQSIARAGEAELMEEAGYRSGGKFFEFHKRKNMNWTKQEKDLNAKKGRHFDGVRMHYVAGPIGKKDSKKLGSEGDALGGMKFVPIDELVKNKIESSSDKKKWGAGYDRAQIYALRSLKKELQGKGIKTAAVAVKRDPSKWEAAKREAKAKMGGKHSARAMQLATQIYKKKGGTYAGKKPSASTNKLKKWTKQKWQWSGKDKPGQGGSGVYLPKKSVSALKSTKVGRQKLVSATREKMKATRSGQQFSSHGLHQGKNRSKIG